MLKDINTQNFPFLKVNKLMNTPFPYEWSDWWWFASQNYAIGLNWHWMQKKKKTFWVKDIEIGLFSLLLAAEYENYFSVNCEKK